MMTTRFNDFSMKQRTNNLKLTIERNQWIIKKDN